LTCLNLAREILSLHEEQVPAGSTPIDEDKLRGLIERVEASLGQPSATSEEASEAQPASESGQAEQAIDASAPLQAPRTLDLPSVEALRDRASARSDEAGASATASEEALPEARAAAGGRERAS
jgi:hypothetical protein